MNKKTLVIATTIIFVLLIILALAISLGKKGKQERVIYSSEEHGFTLAYPIDWKLKDSRGVNMEYDANQLVPSKQKNCKNENGNTADSCLDSIFFGVIKTQSGGDLKSLEDVKKVASEKFGWPDSVKYNNFNSTNIAGKKACTFSVKDESLKQESRFVWIKIDDSRILSLTAAYLDKDQLKVFDAVVKSIKFRKK